MTDMNTVLAELKRGVDEILSEQDLIEKLKENRPLRVKLGADPTAPDIHLGHTVVLNKLRQFQNFGHEVIFLIGDFTGMVGDPSGKNTTRPPLSREDVLRNAETYKQQIFKILDPQKTRIVFNSDWLGKLGTEGMIRLASNYTVARMLERDDFKKRFSNNQPIAIHEFIYPLLQGQDSVALEADVELGGTDQKFNLLVGRELQKSAGQKPQVAITLPLLVGLDGEKKMSKSLGNYIGVTDAPSEMFGKIMSISDDLMWDWYNLLSFRPLTEIIQLKEDVANGKNPRDVKILLAKEIIARFHSEADADTAEQEFINRFQKGAMPDDMPEFTFEGEIGLANLLKDAGLVASTSEANRMVQQGGVKIDGEKVDDAKLIITTSTAVYQVGKRKFAKVTVK
ncbi:Tyrosine--tRNA ligase [Aggregatibacter actinomycetemcomitans]|uniref:tyrosine--tRNA ligase n=2 Tax=Aggregatibacter actinomycetemcomitans TaxID=714 RepID=UPI0001B9F1CF|nr:tyrosine--tRNA ligase [Aggregatibacter actinomycetemcomitans]ACX82588.1 tyrosine--tRNA ligase [Aggregatibacter actinomycetemcomitans D11S-1]KOE57714.1 tyrosine--tRNA ligase [Aggregatibacter actinomycetemcomitans serotype c str. AAS4A]KOE58461.1 tyrosine--tRNA ligase [Aggregatibacter actinomycetemcomitans serotype c str. SCC2302]KOE62464.1 tyrosine--tRNA ligase [Aggregatibacter actinomycetemcomitans serotype c str. D17P-2]KYK77106.1 tyrosyl-tRNA synthetase [Aggregatibacter actinomycetemcomit